MIPLILLALCCVSPVAAQESSGAPTPEQLKTYEAFRAWITKDGPVGGGVVYDTNELLRLFKDLRVIRYEDATAVSDFGLTETRVVRLAAIKR